MGSFRFGGCIAAWTFKKLSIIFNWVITIEPKYHNVYPEISKVTERIGGGLCSMVGAFLWFLLGFRGTILSGRAAFQLVLKKTLGRNMVNSNSEQSLQTGNTKYMQSNLVGTESLSTFARPVSQSSNKTFDLLTLRIASIKAFAQSANYSDSFLITVRDLCYYYFYYKYLVMKFWH